MKKSDIIKGLRERVSVFKMAVADANDDWIIKGFIDIHKNIYTISADTKVISKVLELLLFPSIRNFADDNSLTLELAEHKNHYPDVTIIDNNGNKFALDLKTTYRTNDKNTNGMTLGTYTGYFRDRNGTKNITYPYKSYKAHIVLGIIYSRTELPVDELRRYSVDDLESIVSVIKSFDFFVQEKWKIASDKPGSGNTTNIGSVKGISELKNGKGIFPKYGIKIFDDYWKYYMTKAMARQHDLNEPPYRDLQSYKKYKGI